MNIFSLVLQIYVAGAVLVFVVASFYRGLNDEDPIDGVLHNAILSILWPFCMVGFALFAPGYWLGQRFKDR